MQKNICITGTDRGLGLALVKAFLDQDYHVFAGRLSSALENLQELKQQFPGQLFTFTLDVAADRSVEQARDLIAARTNWLDILINNAGILGDVDTTIAGKLNCTEMLQVFNVNTLGALRVTNALYPLVAAGPTKLIVNISSEAASIHDCDRESWFGYCMSKAALNMQSHLVHNMFRKEGGQVLVFHPGWLQTYMHGYKNTAADYPPETAAAKLYKLIQKHTASRSEKPLFLDVEGHTRSW